MADLRPQMVVKIVDPVSDGVSATVRDASADNIVETIEGLVTLGFGMMFDGTAWDRVRGDATLGLKVDVSGAALTALELIDNIVLLEDDPHASGDSGVMVLAVRNDAPSSLADLDGDYIPFTTDSTGRLYTHDVGVHSEDDPHVSGDSGPMALTVRQDTAGALVDLDGDYQPLSTDAIGRLYVNGLVAADGTVVHDSPDSAGSGPLKIGGRAQTNVAAPDEVGDDDRVDGLFDRIGRLGVYSGYQVKSVPINNAGSGDNTLVSGVAGKKIRVIAVLAVSDGTVDIRFESNAGGTALTGQVPVEAREGYANSNPFGLFETVAGQLLNLELSAAISVHGWVSYMEVDD